MDPPEERIDTFIQALESARGVRIVKKELLTGGTTNRLYRVYDSDGRSWAVKCYFRDDRLRLEREYPALELFALEQIPSVPRPVYRDDGCYMGMYSWIEGVQKKDVEWTMMDVVNLADFIARIHAIPLPSDQSHILPAFMATDTMERVFREALDRLDGLLKEQEKGALPQAASALIDRERIKERAERAIQVIRTDLGQERAQAVFPKEHLRFSVLDVGPHNTLFSSDGVPTYLDFEMAGIDHPFRVVLDFVQHDRTLNLKQELKDAFVKRYFERTHFSEEMLRWYEPMYRVSFIAWAIWHLWTVRQARLEQIRFSHVAEKDVELIVQSHIASHLEKAEKRLRELEVIGL